MSDSDRCARRFAALLAAFTGQDEPTYGSGRLTAIRDVDRFRIRREYAGRRFGRARRAIARP